MKRTYRVTGKFLLLRKSGKPIRGNLYINKKVKADCASSARDKVLSSMTEVFTKKHQEEVSLKQVTNIVVRRV